MIWKKKLILEIKVWKKYLLLISDMVKIQKVMELKLRLSPTLISIIIFFIVWYWRITITMPNIHATLTFKVLVENFSIAVSFPPIADLPIQNNLE